MRVTCAVVLFVACACHCALGSGYTSSYKVHSELVTWQRARKICLAEGTHLAVPRSRLEARYIGRLIEEYEDRLGKKPKIYSIGLYKSPGTTKWKTVFGEEVISIDWGKGHPLKAYTSHLYGSLCQHGAIKSFKGNRKLGFVCKKN